MTTAVGAINHIRGETVTFGLRASDPAYTGAETVTCDVKAAVNGNVVPPEFILAVLSITPVFVAASGGDPAHYLFTMTAAQTAGMAAGDYITDAKIVSADGTVDYPSPLLIRLAARVTA